MGQMPIESDEPVHGYHLDYNLSTLIYNAAEGVKSGQLKPICLKYREYCSFRDNKSAIARPIAVSEGADNNNSHTGGANAGGDPPMSALWRWILVWMKD